MTSAPKRGVSHARARATIEVVTYPRCAASLRDGTACRRTVVKAEQFCSSHLALVQEYGEERVRAGHVPRRKRATVALVPVNRAPQASPVNGDRPEDSRDIRARLADATTRGADEIERVLLEAVGASSPKWASLACRNCGEQQQVEIPVPDVRSRLSAITLLLEQAFGKVGQADERPTHGPSTVAEVEAMSDEELRAIILSDSDGADWLIRQHVQSLSIEARDALRVALDELGSDGEPVGDPSLVS
jgi:hypothetical protein